MNEYSWHTALLRNLSQFPDGSAPRRDGENSLRKHVPWGGTQRLLLALFIAVSTGIGLSQSLDDLPSQGSSNPDCADQATAGSTDCGSAAGVSAGQRTENSPAPAGAQLPTLTPPAGSNPQHYTPSAPPLNPSEMPHSPSPNQPETEFEQMVADSVGRPLPLFGQSLFVRPPSTFSPVDWMQVPNDYVIGPGDELQINIWGQVQSSLRVIVDRSGQIYIPQVGQISVAGIRYENLEEHLTQEISRIFKNFKVSASMGRLHSIQVMVVGDARYPGTYTISSLSTLVNAIFASGGPSAQGSLRHIQVRRDGTTITDFDLYDLLIRGDKSKDVRLQSGDVLYIPHVGPLVAISGSINTPAIYEMKENSSLNDLIEIAGELSTVADSSKITIDRIVDHQARRTLEFPYDEQSRSEALKDGDIVRVFSIVPRFEDTVTLRGNVANPGRYPWKPGMRISDLIPNAQALLTRGYWRDRAAIVNGRATEYPVQTEFPQHNIASSERGAGANAGMGRQPTAYNSSRAPDEADSSATVSPTSENAGKIAENETPEEGDQRARNQQNSGMTENYGKPSVVKNVAEDLRHYVPEINWDYAIIQRVNPQDLSSKLIWMSPRKAIIEHDEASNLELQAGDIVTIFSQGDISVPQAERSRYVIIEGEVKRPGVYKLEVNETLHTVLQRAGGLTPDAYIYGSQFTRESARIDQQRSLDALADSMEVQIRQSAMSAAASSQPGDLPQLLSAQQSIIARLRNTRATGRVALPVNPKDKQVTDFPNMMLEDGDRLTIPHTPSTVSVIGDVYNAGSFIFEPRDSVGEYLELAGKGKPQSDLRHAFVMRANGVVIAANNVDGLFTGNKFDRLRLYPGDQIVVPYKLPTGSLIRGLRDWSQITSQLALTGAAIAVIRP